MSARRAPDSGPDLNGNFGVFFLMNLYTAISTYIYTPVSFTKMFGMEAVWIMERPTESSPSATMSSIVRCKSGIALYILSRRLYLQIRPFHGTDPPTIDREMAEIVRKVRDACNRDEQ
jgi:hypothetical protein